MHLTVYAFNYQSPYPSKKVLQYTAKYYFNRIFRKYTNDSVSLMINLMINGNYLFILLIKRFLVLCRWTTIWWF